MVKKKKTSSKSTQALKIKRVLALIQAGRHEEARLSAEKFSAANPQLWEAWNLLGDCYAGAQLWAQAQTAYRKALALEGGRATPWVSLGSVCFHAGLYGASAEAFAQAVRLDPSQVAVRRNLGVVRNLAGDAVGALDALLHAFALEPQHEQTRRDMGVLMSNPAVYGHELFTRENPLLRAPLNALFRDPTAWHQGLAPLAGLQLCAQYLDGEEPAMETLVVDPLLLSLLKSAIVVNVQLEGLLIEQRDRLLQAVLEDRLDERSLPLLAALAQAGFNNEYVWTQAGTAEQLERLEQCIDAAPTALDVTAYGMYREPARLAAAARLPALPDWRGPLLEVRRRLLEEPLEERATQVPVLVPVEDDTSRRVRAQYEEHPFPRWTNLGQHPADLKTSFKHHFPNRTPPSGINASRILVAGGGTGQHPIGVALANPSARVTAIDLSRASSAYALRMARAMGVANISFAQADILGLADWEQRFDHIESMGVLHHMAEPLAGWRILRSLLRPGGTMRLGLYSELGRRGVVKAREIIAAEGVPADNEGIRTFRTRLLTDPALAWVFGELQGLDFFATSTLRDLIFHVSEQRYSLDRLKRELAELELDFVGFELSELPYKTLYQQQFPDDPNGTNLDNWAELETRHPRLFSKMYNFWVQA